MILIFSRDFLFTFNRFFFILYFCVAHLFTTSQFSCSATALHLITAHPFVWFYFRFIRLCNLFSSVRSFSLAFTLPRPFLCSPVACFIGLFKHFSAPLCCNVHSINIISVPHVWIYKKKIKRREERIIRKWNGIKSMMKKTANFLRYYHLYWKHFRRL